MRTIEKIRQEIERHRQVIRVLNEHTAPEGMSKTCAIFQYSDSILSELLSFLNTLSEEPDKSLEEEIDRFEDWMETYNQSDYPTSFTTRDIARHFAEWGAEHLCDSTKMIDKSLDEAAKEQI